MFEPALDQTRLNQEELFMNLDCALDCTDITQPRPTVVAVGKLCTPRLCNALFVAVSVAAVRLFRNLYVTDSHVRLRSN